MQWPLAAITAAHLLGMECTRFWTVSTGMACHAAWSSCHRASRLPGLLLSTFLKRTSHKCSGLLKVWALGQPLQDLDVRALEESRHLVRFMARSIVLLEDKCFTLAINKITLSDVIEAYLDLWTAILGCSYEIGQKWQKQRQNNTQNRI